MEQLARFKNLVPEWWVNELINGGKPAHYDSSKFIAVHAHYRNRDTYLGSNLFDTIILLD